MTGKSVAPKRFSPALFCFGCRILQHHVESLDLKSLSKPPILVALHLILPMEGERDVFDRVCRLRRFNMIVAFIFAVLAVFDLPSAGKFVSGMLAAAFSFYSIYQLILPAN
jgi:hypothetical protein